MSIEGYGLNEVYGQSNSQEKLSQSKKTQQSIAWAEQTIKNMKSTSTSTTKTENWTADKIIQEYTDYAETKDLVSAIINLTSTTNHTGRTNALKLLAKLCSDQLLDEWEMAGRLVNYLDERGKLSPEELQILQSIYEKAATGLVEVKHYTRETIKENEKALQYRQTRKKLESIARHYTEFQNLMTPVMEQLSTGERGCALFINNKEVLIFSPTNKLLQMQADYYKEKYGIEINITAAVEEEDLEPIAFADNLVSVLKERLDDLATDRNVGIIYSGVLGGHAVPLILQVKDGKAAVLVLDVLGVEFENNANDEAIAALKKFQIPHICCSDLRQADMYSCRTGALVTLRNALLDLINKKNPSIFDFVKYHGEFNEDGTTEQTFKMPASWGAAHDQIYRPGKEDNLQENLPTRQFASDRKAARSLETAKAEHKEETMCDCRFEIALEPSELENLGQLPQLPPEVSISDGNLIVSWQEKEMLNTYMTKKAESIFNRALGQQQIGTEDSETEDSSEASLKESREDLSSDSLVESEEDASNSILKKLENEIYNLEIDLEEMEIDKETLEVSLLEMKEGFSKVRKKDLKATMEDVESQITALEIKIKTTNQELGNLKAERDKL